MLVFVMWNFKSGSSFMERIFGMVRVGVVRVSIINWSVLIVLGFGFGVRWGVNGEFRGWGGVCVGYFEEFV